MILKSANFGNNAGKIRDISFFIPAQCKPLYLKVNYFKTSYLLGSMQKIPPSIPTNSHAPAWEFIRQRFQRCVTLQRHWRHSHAGAWGYLLRVTLS